MNLADKNVSNYLYLSTPLGPMLACASKHGICLLEFSNEKDLKDQIRGAEKKLEASLTESHHPLFPQLQNELDEYFSGTRKKFTVPLELIGTDFQKKVWKALPDIPYGETRSYTQQSIILNNHKGIRAIASANAKNKIAVLIPCHRVIGRDGELTGYAGGLSRKEWLLHHEAKYSGKAIQHKLAF